MKTETKTRFIVYVVALFLMAYVTVTPIVLTKALNREKAKVEFYENYYETHYAKGDSIDFNFLDSINRPNPEIYENK